jgi:hypothetical protein
MFLQRTAIRFFAGAVVLLLLLDWTVLQCGEPGNKTMHLHGGGQVRGTVRLSGSVSDMTVPTGKDDKICGPTVLLSRLSTGRNGGVKNAIVYIQNIEGGKPFAPGKKYLLDQQGCKYKPHVMVLPFGSPLEIVNNDPILHNVHVSELGSGRMSLLNIAQPIRGQRSVIQGSQIRKSGFLVATCDAGHPWMNAYIMVAESPYYSMTDTDGNYVIDDIPPGEYWLTMWHEGVRVTKVVKEGTRTVRYEYEDPYVAESQLTIERGQSSRVDFSMQLR